MILTKEDIINSLPLILKHVDLSGQRVTYYIARKYTISSNTISIQNLRSGHITPESPEDLLYNIIGDWYYINPYQLGDLIVYPRDGDYAELREVFITQVTRPLWFRQDKIILLERILKK